jgi:hypothetical protein
MPNEPLDLRAESLPVLLPWGVPLAQASDDGPALWLAGAASLLAWTLVALLLTA